jgi:hypothetical protein
LIVLESQNRVAVIFQEGLTLGVFFLRVFVYRPVNLDDQLLLSAVEVNDKRADGVLATKT